MAVVPISNYFAEWIPSGRTDACGIGRIVLRGARHLTDLYWLNNLHPEDFRILLNLLQSEKPLYWDTQAECLRTAHPQSLDAEPVGEEEREPPLDRERSAVVAPPAEARTDRS